MRVERSQPRRGRDGFALVAVVAVMALLSGLLSCLSLWSRNSVENAAVAASDLKVKALLHSAREVAAYQLFVLKLPRERVNNQKIALDEGEATVSLDDDSGKVDINRSGVELLAAAYRASGLSRISPEAFAARVLDWRDSDDVISNGGAEAAAYGNASLPPPRNSDFRTISDLRWVLGVNQTDLLALAPFITVFNRSGRLNPYSTSSPLMNALPGSTSAVTSDILRLISSPRTEQNKALIKKMLEGNELFIFEEAPLNLIVLRIICKTWASRIQEISLLVSMNASDGLKTVWVK